MARPCEVRVHLPALKHNCHVIQQLAPAANIVAVVKANAYGHGAVAVANYLEQQNLVAAFTVTSLEEALALRQAGINKPILLLEGVFDAEEIVLAAEHQLQLVVHCQQQAALLAAYGTKQGYPQRLWLKVDTGMTRLGLSASTLPKVAAQLSGAFRHAQPVLMSHLACADALDNPFTDMQLLKFQHMAAVLRAQGVRFTTSLANSAGLLGWPKTHGDWLRPGLALYGASPFAEAHPLASKLLPVMGFYAKVIALHQVRAGDSVGYGQQWRAPRDGVIATVAAGYADGYPRHIQAGARATIVGQSVPVVGRVSMDMLAVDVSQITKVNQGDWVELWGENQPVEQLAEQADSIPHHLLSGVAARVRRRYV